MPEDKIERTDFGREITRDLSTPEKEYGALMYPVSQVFDWDQWQDGFDKFWPGDQNQKVRDDFRTFKRQILENFKYYRVPVIALDRTTSKEAVCVVFEKVNTGGKALDAFELVTAMYAASGHELRKDWYGDEEIKGRHRRLALGVGGRGGGAVGRGRSVVSRADDAQDEAGRVGGGGLEQELETGGLGGLGGQRGEGLHVRTTLSRGGGRACRRAEKKK